MGLVNVFSLSTTESRAVNQILAILEHYSDEQRIKILSHVQGAVAQSKISEPKKEEDTYYTRPEFNHPGGW